VSAKEKQEREYCTDQYYQMRLIGGRTARVGVRLLIMFWVSSCVETAKFGAIVVVESSMMMGECRNWPCSDFDQTYIRSLGDT